MPPFLTDSGEETTAPMTTATKKKELLSLVSRFTSFGVKIQQQHHQFTEPEALWV